MKTVRVTEEEFGRIKRGEKTWHRLLLEHRVSLAAGHGWAQCVCAEIDIADTPCIVCESRFDIPFEVGDRVRFAVEKRNGYSKTVTITDASVCQLLPLDSAVVIREVGSGYYCGSTSLEDLAQMKHKDFYINEVWNPRYGHLQLPHNPWTYLFHWTSK